ncbi:Photosynthetic NDH subunit of lumenal location 2 [Hibiscus syriacus]|uniref:Photosynthetic NDH subunit of lumenal location 2 n=1 Tax=Hibiscus syriacus TaxID=106335 RepID=A0A6A3BR56_HIBSY|nr:photosynthetic NDH subunit of lumenal location 2, chloroplastic-like [Hibiscus syriacus]KAE8719390.1 Photosynthetic NDH subunit of lumenal location 2 [Hibiscus syriacus]
MSSFISSTFSTHVNQSFPTPQTRHCSKLPLSVIRASVQPEQNNVMIIGNRRKLVTSFVAASLAALGLQGTEVAMAENWGTHSFLRERFFEPGLSPEDAAARIKQTAEGLHSMRDMLDTMSWRYVMFYIRLKQAYLSQDLKNAMNTLPQGRKDVYVKTANELVDNMSEFDYYVRTPKVYESYLYYEKSLKSIDDLVALLG